MSRENLLVCYTDGSAQPNPGNAGYGLFGYVLKPSKKPKSVNWPLNNNFKITSKGIKPKTFKLDENYEVLDIVDHIGSINDRNGTNNQGELLGFTQALITAFERDDVSHLHIITDSQYVLNGFEKFLKNWERNGFKTKNDEPVKNEQFWRNISKLKGDLETKGVKVTHEWVKGHNDEIGNEIADTYALIGMNYSRQQFNEGDDCFSESCFSQTTPTSLFRKQLDARHFVFEYKSALFSSNFIKDNEKLLLVSTFNPTLEEEIGKRMIGSAYAIMHKGVPKSINILKADFRDNVRVHNVNCKINLDTLKKDKLLSRITDEVGYEPVTTTLMSKGRYFCKTFNKEEFLVEDLGTEYTHIMEATKTFDMLDSAIEFFDNLKSDGSLFNLTDLFYEDNGELKVKYTDRMLDLTDTIVSKEFTPTNKLIVNYGLDLPSYAVFKSLVGHVKGVYIYPDFHRERNLLSLICIIEYEDEKGEVCKLVQTNLYGKYLVKKI